jgi:hypothetical protein
VATAATSERALVGGRRAGIALCLASACGFGLMAIFAAQAYRAGIGVTTLLAARFVLAARCSGRSWPRGSRATGAAGVAGDPGDAGWLWIAAIDCCRPCCRSAPSCSGWRAPSRGPR